MAKETVEASKEVTLTIEDHTTIVIGGVEYSGTVLVSPDVSEVLKNIGKVKDEPTDA